MAIQILCYLKIISSTEAVAEGTMGWLSGSNIHYAKYYCHPWNVVIINKYCLLTGLSHDQTLNGERNPYLF